MSYGHTTLVEHILKYHKEGAEAYREGKTLADNPYPSDAPERPSRHELWVRGWVAARME